MAEKLSALKRKRKEDALALARLLYDIYKEEKAVVKLAEKRGARNV